MLSGATLRKAFARLLPVLILPSAPRRKREYIFPSWQYLSVRAAFGQTGCQRRFQSAELLRCVATCAGLPSAQFLRLEHICATSTESIVAEDSTPIDSEITHGKECQTALDPLFAFEVYSLDPRPPRTQSYHVILCREFEFPIRLEKCLQAESNIIRRLECRSKSRREQRLEMSSQQPLRKVRCVLSAPTRETMSRLAREIAEASFAELLVGAIRGMDWRLVLAWRNIEKTPEDKQGVVAL